MNFKCNVLNLLSEVKAGSSVKAKYSYLKDGTKLRVRDGNGVNGFDYIGSLKYKKSSAGCNWKRRVFMVGLYERMFPESLGRWFSMDRLLK